VTEKEKKKAAAGNSGPKIKRETRGTEAGSTQDSQDKATAYRVLTIQQANPKKSGTPENEQQEKRDHEPEATGAPAKLAGNSRA